MCLSFPCLSVLIYENEGCEEEKNSYFEKSLRDYLAP